MPNHSFPLTFRRLRKVNAKRCRKAFPECFPNWSLAEWSNALCGEGEAANITKKILRGDKPYKHFKKDLAKELADVVIYADLLATAGNINLEKAVIDKFNEVSERKKCKIRL